MAACLGQPGSITQGSSYQADRTFAIKFRTAEESPWTIRVNSGAHPKEVYNRTNWANIVIARRLLCNRQFGISTLVIRSV